ncbi:hypothetical protein ABER98_11485 [Domibacillus aminovorans]|uniref:hypothetical protein n=1 Tax=Domibacillus aminovorans TaxID=29332 RepID=UPI003D19E4E9
MKRKIDVLSLLVLGLAITFFYFQGNSIDAKGRNELEANMITSMKNNPSQVDFNKVTNFKWDKMYTFTPYTPDKEITKQLGFKWKYSNETNIDYLDDINLLVFVNDDRVIQYLELSREYGDFDFRDKNNITPTNSVIHLKQIK